jgi:hypothetical protein
VSYGNIKDERVEQPEIVMHRKEELQVQCNHCCESNICCIENVPIFAGLSRDEMLEIAEIASSRSYQPGWLGGFVGCDHNVLSSVPPYIIALVHGNALLIMLRLFNAKSLLANTLTI